MEPDAFQKAWQVQSTETRITIDVDLLRKEVQRQQQDFRTIVFWRDFREVGVALVMIPVWFYLGARNSSPWSWYLTVPVLVWIAGFMLVYRKRYQSRPSEPGEPLLVCVGKSLAEVEAQIWLLRNILWWYLLPPTLSIMAFFVHVTWRSASGWGEFVVGTLVCGLVLLLVYGAIYLLNQYAVRAQLEPRRQELLALQAGLEDDSNRGKS